ncbi:MAG: hypothetical protein JWQ43_7 [Glaciihabitans sp.]|nr:hypothetical protein [Glaciihabitans sp.]
MILLAQIAALVAIVGVGIVFGTDTFCALVQRPALARVDDAAMTSVMGNEHRYGDKRMPVPGVLGLIGSAIASVLAAVTGHTAAAVAVGVALVLLVAWLILYTQISSPINQVFIAAVDRGATPVDARALQNGWDGIIVLRATLQGLALLGLAMTLILL